MSGWLAYQDRLPEGTAIFAISGWSTNCTLSFSNNHMSSNIFFNNHDQDHDDDDDDGDDGDDDGRICVFCGNGNGIVKVGRMHLHHGQVFPRSREPTISGPHWWGFPVFCSCEKRWSYFRTNNGG